MLNDIFPLSLSSISATTYSCYSCLLMHVAFDTSSRNLQCWFLHVSNRWWITWNHWISFFFFFFLPCGPCRLVCPQWLLGWQCPLLERWPPVRQATCPPATEPCGFETMASSPRMYTLRDWNTEETQNKVDWTGVQTTIRQNFFNGSYETWSIFRPIQCLFVSSSLFAPL